MPKESPSGRTIPTKIGNAVSAAVGYRPPVRREDSPLKLSLAKQKMYNKFFVEMAKPHFKRKIYCTFSHLRWSNMPACEASGKAKSGKFSRLLSYLFIYSKSDTTPLRGVSLRTFVLTAVIMYADLLYRPYISRETL